MNQLVPLHTREATPALITAAGERAQLRFLEFFTANIRNPHTRRAYAQAAQEFLAWPFHHDEVLDLLEIWRGASFACDSATG